MSEADSEGPPRPHTGRGATVLGAAAFVALATAIVIAFMAAGPASALDATPRLVESSQQGSGDGASIYAASCSACHQADGAGIPGSFPPLRGNPNVADTAYVETVVTDGLSGPIEVNGEAFDQAMPAVAGLSPAEVTAVSEYVASLAEGGETSETTTPEPPEPGGPGEGRTLFEGGTRFENGAAACVACHTAGEVGNFGGPGLGPDLTDSVEKLGGEAGLAGWLKTPPAPTMTPIFADRPLTDPEIADLVAFLNEAPSQTKADSAIDWLGFVGAIVAVLLLAGMAIAWRGMRQTYAEVLRSKR